MQRLASSTADLALPLRLPATLLLLAALLCGQDNRWDIPHRGAHVYDRQTRTFELTPPPSKLTPVRAIADGRSNEPHRWRYLTCAKDKAPKDFHRANYADASWSVGLGGFGTGPKKDGPERTAWRSAVLCLRTTCDLGRSKPKALWFVVDHDDGVRIWLNGTLVVSNDGYGRNHSYVVTGKELKAWQKGENQLAVQCTNTGGAQYLDLELNYFPRLPRGAKTEKALLKAIRLERESVNRVHRALFDGYRPPPMLLQGELDDKGSHVLRSPVDLREIAWFTAMDLRCGTNGGSVRLDATRMYELGDLQIRGRASSADDQGWQTIEASTKTTRQMAAGRDDKGRVANEAKRFVHHAFDGKLKIRRRLEQTAKGLRVVEFETDLHGTVKGDVDFKQVVGSVAQQERWQLVRTHANRDATYRSMVQQSIERGVKKLREQLGKHGSDNQLKAEKPDGDRSYNSGRLAIGILALIKGGVPKDDAVLVAALDELRKRTLIDTYSLGNGLMAISSYYQPPNEWDLLRTGQIKRAQPRELPAADFELMEKWTERLLNNIDTRVDPTQLTRWNYVEGGNFDNSVHQYGLLGLHAAHLCGVEISPIVWESAANHLLDVQAEEGKRVNLELIDYWTHSRMLFNPEARVTTNRSISRARGWSYKEGVGNGAEAGYWGSMTCAGITGLAICQAALQENKKVKFNRLQGNCDEARLDGFAWLAQHMTVRHNPGALTRQRRWLYYYLYSLERAALLSGIALIQDRDWYFEAAMMLAGLQQDDGNWPSELNGDQQIERNAMAILLMKQSTTPVLTGK